MSDPSPPELIGSISFSKVVTELPTTLAPSTLYLVLNSEKVYIWVSNKEGTTAYPLKTLSDNQTDEIFSAMLNTVNNQ